MFVARPGRSALGEEELLSALCPEAAQLPEPGGGRGLEGGEARSLGLLRVPAELGRPGGWCALRIPRPVSSVWLRG